MRRRRRDITKTYSRDDGVNESTNARLTFINEALLTISFIVRLSQAPVLVLATPQRHPKRFFSLLLLLSYSQDTFYII